MKVPEQLYSAYILTAKQPDTHLRFPVLVTFSDPIKTPLGLKVIGQFAKSGTAFVIDVDDLDKGIAEAKALAITYEEPVVEPEPA